LKLVVAWRRCCCKHGQRHGRRDQRRGKGRRSPYFGRRMLPLAGRPLDTWQDRRPCQL
jgi:hypothetical protein